MRWLKLSLIVSILGILLSSCVYDRGLVLFNTEPITKQNVLNDQKTFQAGTRVYYLFLAPQKMENEFIRVQIFKMTDKAPWGGHEVLRTKDYRLMKDERYYHTDYFVLHEKADMYYKYFLMMIFSIL